MKLINLPFYVMGAFVVALIIFIPFGMSRVSNQQERCAQRGGVVFESRGSVLCLKPEAVIDVREK